MQAVPSQDDVMTALRAVLAAALPGGTPIVLGQANRVPEATATSHAVMTPLRRSRLSTNLHNAEDCRFVGSVAGAVLTVTSVSYGAVTPGRALWGVGIAGGSVIGAQISGTPGGIGTYGVTPTQTVGPVVLAAGVYDLVSAYEFDVQIDFYGTGADSQPADNAQTVSTLFRDDWATDQFAAQTAAPTARATVIPLHADDPRFLPGFVDGEDQYEDRWLVEVRLQVNETVQVPQQYAEAARVGLIDVDAEYPA